MREISLRNRRFEEIQAQTGMSSHLLSVRLRRLEEDKIIERHVYSARPLRHEYFATPKGKDLDAVILALRNWDLRWGGSDGNGAAAINLTDKKTGKVIDGCWHNQDGETFSFSNTNAVISDAWKAEREANAAAFYASKQRATPRAKGLAAKSAKKGAKSVGKKSARVKASASKPTVTKPTARKRAAKVTSKAA